MGNAISIEITSTLYFVLAGSIFPSSFPKAFASSTPSIFGSSGPFISASRSPTLNAFCARVTARLVATVDFPTPPFPLITIIVCFTLYLTDFPGVNDGLGGGSFIFIVPAIFLYFILIYNVTRFPFIHLPLWK